MSALRNIYPEESWKSDSWTRHKLINGLKTSKIQYSLYLYKIIKSYCLFCRYTTLRSLFRDTAVHLNYTSCIDLTYPSYRRPFEFDIFLPALALAFEYQGEPHYLSVGMFGSHTNRKKTDQFKKEKTKEYGITLIEIPYWWDRSVESLVATIQKHRPGMLVIYIVSYC
jgi:hypothetical protein